MHLSKIQPALSNGCYLTTSNNKKLEEDQADRGAKRLSPSTEQDDLDSVLETASQLDSKTSQCESCLENCWQTVRNSKNRCLVACWQPDKARTKQDEV